MNDPSLPVPACRWYHVPFMWLVVGIPALTVVAGLSMVVVATVGRDTVVVDDFRKDGLAINVDPRRDTAARRLGVEARVSGADGGQFVVDLQPGTGEAPRRLVLVLSHATRAEHDRLVSLERATDGSYRAALGDLPRGHWFLELTPADRAWRLTGDFVDRVGTLTLRPPAG